MIVCVRQRTQTINALRGHLAEFGVVAPQGPAHVGRLALALDDPGSALPEPVRDLGALLLGQIADLDGKIGGLEKELLACARRDEEASRLMTIPEVGPITAMALQAFAPPMETVVALLGEALLPAPDAGLRLAGPAHDPIGADAISAVQYDPCAPNMLLGDVAVPDERLQTTTVGRAQDDADSWAHEPDSHTESPAGTPLGIQMSDFIH